MESQQEPSDNQVPGSVVSSVDKPQHDHAIISPPIEDDSSSSLLSSLSSIFSSCSSLLSSLDDTTDDDELAMEGNDPSFHDDVGDDEIPAHIASTSQVNVTTSGSNDLPVVGDSTTNQEMVMEDAAPLRKKPLAPILTLVPKSSKHVNDHDDKMEVDSSTTHKEEPTGGHPTPSQDEPESHQTPTLFLVVTPPRPASPRSSRVTTSSTIRASTLCNPSLGEGTVSAPKRRWSPSLVDEITDRMDASVPSDPQRDFVFSNMIRNLTESWRQVVELCGMRLGSREAVNTTFAPDVEAIREKAMRWWAPLDEIADATEAAMLEQWTNRCRRVIQRYHLDMRRDLVSEARAKARGIKDQVLADAAQIKEHAAPSDPNSPRTPNKRLRIPSTPGSRSHLFDLPPPFSSASPSPSPYALPLPLRTRTQTQTQTRDSETTRKRPASLDVDALRSRIAGLDLLDLDHESDVTSPPPRTPTSGGDGAKRLRFRTTSVSVPREPLRLPKGLTTPARRRFGGGARERVRVPSTPTRASRRASTPTPTPRVVGEGEGEGGEDVDVDMDMDRPGPAAGYQVVGHIGPYAVVEPPAQDGRMGFAATATAVADADDDDGGNDADVSAEEEEEEQDGGEDENEDEDMEDGDDDVFTSHK